MTIGKSADKLISVVGAGLAGSECALQLADMGFRVKLFEMREKRKTPAHKTHLFAELVCSNSFGSLGENSAPGQIKWEAQKLGSHILSAAMDSIVPAGHALAVDRDLFAQKITDKIHNHPKIEVVSDVVHSLDQVPRPTVIATGPLTDSDLAEDMKKHFGDFLYFFDAIAPIIDADSIDTEIAWKADRWGRGSSDYYNCPMNREQYENFIRAILDAKKTEPKDFEKTPYFEGCMPIEALVERGADTPRFGPMKPVGLRDPRTGKDHYAVVQLRQENQEGTSYNMVGFQTKMAYGDQVRVFRMIPGLENAEFLKLGSIHRNLYLHSPKLLSEDLSSPEDPLLFFAGQITGVEGYFESTCIGLLVAHFLKQKLNDEPFAPPPRESAMGALLHAITDRSKTHFQPTNINFGLLPSLKERIKKKDEKKAKQISLAREGFMSWLPSSKAP